MLNIEEVENCQGDHDRSRELVSDEMAGREEESQERRPT